MDRTKADAVVTTTEGTTDPDVLTADELRRRLLYDPDAADAICERHLGMPARSDEYIDAPTVQTGLDGGGDQIRNSPEGPDSTGGGPRWTGEPDESNESNHLRVSMLVAIITVHVLVVFATVSGVTLVGNLLCDDTPSAVLDDDINRGTRTLRIQRQWMEVMTISNRPT